MPEHLLEHAILVRNLTKSYGSFDAVDDISFNVPVGSLFAFLGTNGAGKTTTINCLSTILQPTSGEITIAGHKVGINDEHIRRLIGVVFQDSLLDPALTGRENLLMRAKLYGIDPQKAMTRIAELSTLIEIDTVLDRRYGKLSGGQRRRVDIVRALLHEPSILFLDEPTTGLDPDSREKVWQAITSLQDTLGLTVFLTTHYMAETERADMVHIINSGKIIVSGTPTQLRSKYAGDELHLLLKPDLDISVLPADTQSKGDERFVPVVSSAEALKLLNEHKDAIVDFEFRHGTMDDVFLNVTRGSK